MPRQRDHVRDFPGRRGLNLGPRSLHPAGIVLLGAALLGATGGFSSGSGRRRRPPQQQVIDDEARD